jgi:hypothetical protein
MIKIAHKLITDLGIITYSNGETISLCNISYYEGKGDILNLIKEIKNFKNMFAKTIQWSIM